MIIRIIIIIMTIMIITVMTITKKIKKICNCKINTQSRYNRTKIVQIQVIDAHL